MKIVNVVGNRPHLIKTAVLSKEIRARGHTEVIVHSGQHYDYELSGVFLDELEIPAPDYNLDVGSGSHAVQTGEIMMRLEPILCHISPDVVIVHGDTNTTLAAALTAVKLKIPLAHVESGLRSFDRTMPEEINRICTDHVSNYLFCPSDRAVKQLARESINKNVFFVGDVMLDTFDLVIPKLEKVSGSPYAVATIHREENTTPEIIRIILAGFEEYGGKIVFPMHPRTSNLIDGERIAIPKNVQVISPQGYVNMLNLMYNSELVVTDSGGIQKEAYALRKRCVTIRDTTEWPETVSFGWNTLVKKDPHRIADAMKPTKQSGYVVWYRVQTPASKGIVKVLEGEVPIE